jgi:endonuclease-3 related protein
VDDQTNYYDLQDYFMDNLPEDVKLFNEFHALIVMAGKEYCRRKPLCESCPLAEWER